jgi:hypothetical protein
MIPNGVGLVGLSGEYEVDRDRRARWEVGRALYGGGPFVGNPVEECDQEFLDALNYLEEIRVQTVAFGHGPSLDEIDAIFRAVSEICIRFRRAMRPPFEPDSAVDSAPAGGTRA